MNMEKSLPRDVFLHFLSILALYISAGGFIALLFQYINVFLPDPLDHYSYQNIAGSIRWAMASLIIVFPVYVLVSWLLNKDYFLNPEKRELKIRKWLVYFTLFVTAIAIISDLVALVYKFLGGDLTARFLLKAAVVLLVAGAVFGYYLGDLRKKFADWHLKMLTWLVSAVILAGIVAGFFTAGSPLKARLVRFDERRINDLQTIQGQIINYWIQKEKLPPELSALTNNITGFFPPVDPVTGELYSYRVLSADPTKPSFELCAIFDLDSKKFLTSPSRPAPYYSGQYEENWSYKKGETCFTRVIDPDFYKEKVVLEKPIRY